MLENCISLYKANLQYAPTLFTVCRSHFKWTTISNFKSNVSHAGNLRTLGLQILNQIKDWLWLNACPLAGKLYPITWSKTTIGLKTAYCVSVRFPPLRKCRLIEWFSICWKTVSYYTLNFQYAWNNEYFGSAKFPPDGNLALIYNVSIW